MSAGLQFEDVLARLQALPNTFKRIGPNYSILENTIANAIYRFCEGSNGILSQLDFNNSDFSWLDLYGQIFSVPRNVGEQDAVYRARIKNNLRMARGSPVAIQKFMSYNYGSSAEITENFTTVSWAVQMPTTIPSSQYPSIVQNLKYVRPAGAPFNALSQAGGIYIGAS